MKLSFVPTISATLLYLILFWFYYQDEAASDGFTQMGFPFCFYTNSGGKFLPGYRPAFGFNILLFLLDLLVLFLMILVTNFLYIQYMKRSASRRIL
jgi:hypothetical protein